MLSPNIRSKLRLYLVTDRHQTGGRPLLACVEAALRGGVRAVQLREKDLGTRDLLALALEMRELTRRHDSLLLINDRIDVALACQADGVHLPLSSFGPTEARALLGSDRLIGVSTHTESELLPVAAEGADFAVFGPVFDTPSKRPYGPPLGLPALERAARVVRIPVLAIGGITADRLPEVLQTGAAGAAIIRALLEASDPERAARSFIERLSGVRAE